MIPARLIKFINEEADMGMLGTRSADNEPRAHRIFGFHISDDGTRIRAFVPAMGTRGLSDSLADNGRAAITVGNTRTHETYQIKGAAAAPGDPTAADLSHFERFRTRLVAGAVEYGVPEEVAITLVAPPVCAVEVTIEDLFLQTPGPGAGERISIGEGE